MAGPTPTEQAMITLLNGIKDELKQMNSQASTSKVNQENYKDKRSYQNMVKSLDKLEKNANDLSKTFDKAKDEYKQSASVFGKSLREVVRDYLVPGARSVKKTFDELNTTLENIEQHQTAEFKKLAAGTRDYLKTNKNATAQLKEANSAYRDYVGVIKSISKNQNTVTKKDMDNIENLSKIIRKLQTEANINPLSNLTREQQAAFTKLRANMKLTNDDFRELSRSAKKIGENFNAINSASTDYYKGLTTAQNNLHQAMTESMKSLMTNLKLAGAGIPQVFKDLMAQARNAVGTSNYDQAFRLGVTQAELSDFMGQNRLALRSMGGGSSAAAINNGGINQLQNQAHSYGLYGNDALKFIGSSFDSMIKMGLAPSVENASKQMQTLYETMQVTGMTFDQINTLVSDLSNSPAFVQLAQSKGFEGQTDQISILTKMLRTEGYSADYLKQLLDLNKQANYQGIEQAVRGMVGVQLLGGQINRTLGRNAVSQEDIGLLQELKARGPGALEARYAAGAYNDFTIGGKRVTEMFGTGTEGASRFSAYALQRQLDVNKLQQQAFTGASASDDLYGGLVNKTLLGSFNTLAGQEYQQQDAALMAQANLKALTGSTTPGKSAVDQMMGASDELVKTINDINNAFIPFGETLNKYLPQIQEGITGFKGNPGGQSATGLFGAAKDIVNSILIYKGLTKVGGMLGGAGGGAGMLSRIGGFASGIGGRLMGAGSSLFGAAGGAAGAIRAGAGTLGRGAAGLAGSPAGMVAGAGLGGYAAGSLLNVAPEYIGKLFGTQFDSISTNIVDGIFKITGKDAAIAEMFNPTPTAMNKKAELVEEPVTPDGSTMGDLFSQMVETLTSIDETQRKLLESTELIHKENMDFAVKKGNDDLIQAARMNVRSVLANAG